MTLIKHLGITAMGKNNTTSEINAREIHRKFFDNSGNTTSQIISIEGTFGSGKSTVKDELKKLLKEKSFNSVICVDYKALQYEETSQITSQLYMQIADELLPHNKHAFSACAVLKKENLEASYITGSFGVLALIISLIVLVIGSLKTIFPINDATVFGILFISLIASYSFRNQMVRIISGFMPRYTHIKVLRNDLDKTEFEGKTLVLLIDESDRLTATTLKLLLDEVLILHEILTETQVNIKHKFLLFCNAENIHSLLTQCQISDVEFYLQKYRQARHIILKPEFLHTLHKRIFGCKPAENIFSTNIPPYAENIFAPPIDKNKTVPSSSILNLVNKYLRSFRELDDFIIYLSTNANTYKIGRVMDNYQSIDKDFNCRQYLADLLITEIFFAFRYERKLSELAFKLSTSSENDMVVSIYQEFLTALTYMYGTRITIPENNSENTHSKTSKKFNDSIDKLENIYYENTRIYPSTLDGSKLTFNLDDENNLENILKDDFESDETKANIIDYIKTNLSEFAISQQVHYPHLGNLKNNDLLVNPNNVEEFLALITKLENEIAIKLHELLNSLSVKFNYAQDLYSAAINAICYMINKLIPSDNCDEVISIMIASIAKNLSNYSMSLYIALERMMHNNYRTGENVPRIQFERLLKSLDQNLPDQVVYPNTIFLFNYLYILCQRNNFRTWFSDYSAGGIVNKLEIILKSQNMITQYLIGVAICNKLYDYKLAPTYLLVGGTKAIFADYEMKEFKAKDISNDFYQAVEETLNLYKIQS